MHVSWYSYVTREVLLSNNNTRVDPPKYKLKLFRWSSAPSWHLFYFICNILNDRSSYITNNESSASEMNVADQCLGSAFGD